MKAVLVTAYNAKMAPIGDLTAPRMQHWASRHGYDFHCARVFDPNCEPFWQKLWEIRNLISPSNPLRKAYDQVIWLDADQVITNFDWTPPWGKGFHASLDWGTDATSDTHFSACGFVVCKDSFNIILAACHRYDLYCDKEFPEQMALRSLMTGTRYSKDFTIHPRRTFNAVPASLCPDAPEPWQEGDFCAHLTHVPVEDRVSAFHQLFSHD